MTGLELFTGILQAMAFNGGVTLVATGMQERVKQYLQKRQDDANEILIGELKRGEIQSDALRDVDTLLSLIMHYHKAVQEGASVHNLRLMAKIMRGTLEHTDDIGADRCTYLMAIAAELSLEEMKLVAGLYEKKNQVTDGESPDFILMKELVPVTYPTEEHFKAAVARLSRTGLVVPASGFGSIVYSPSPLMDELIALVREREWYEMF